MIRLDHDTTSPKKFNTNDWHPKWNPDRELETIAVLPFSTNPRMIAQRSAFTLMADKFAPLDEQFNGRLVAEGALVKIELPARAYEEVQQFLEVVGLTPYSFYPDLEGLALKHKADVQWTLRRIREFYPDRIKKP